MNISELSDIFNFLDKNFNEDFEELYSSFDYLTKSFIEIKNKVSQNLQIIIAQGRYSETEEQLEYLKRIDALIKEMETICQKYNPDDFSDKKENEKTENKEEEPKKTQIERINYANYKVDNEQEHYLTEDFTNKRPYAFSFLGKKYKVSKWKNLYALVCEIFVRKDLEKFKKLINILKGKRPYISYSASDFRSPQKLSYGLYIETNMSAKQLTENITILLKHYGYKTNDVIIYLASDYTNLH